jgi:copper(I)-binding protein
MLLQTRQPLAVGDKFTCAIDFQKAGTIEMEVNVRSLP